LDQALGRDVLAALSLAAEPLLGSLDVLEDLLALLHPAIEQLPQLVVLDLLAHLLDGLGGLGFGVLELVGKEFLPGLDEHGGSHD
jgi:hypothetical protein